MINPFIFSILIFISPYIISKLFKLNNYQGYLFGLLSFLAVLGLGFCLGFVAGIIIVILSLVISQSTTFTVFTSNNLYTYIARNIYIHLSFSS